MLHKFITGFFITLAALANLAAWALMLTDRFGFDALWLDATLNFLVEVLAFFFPMQFLYPIALGLREIDIILGSYLAVTLALISAPLCYVTSQVFQRAAKKTNFWFVFATYLAISLICYLVMRQALLG